MSNPIKRRWTGVLATGALACPLAAGVATAAGTDHVYNGHTSQHQSATLTVTSNGSLAFSVSFRERCFTPSHRSSGSSSGSYNFTPGTGVHADRHGHFSHHYHASHVLTSAGDQYFNGDYRVSGQISGKNASGKFSVTVRFYSLHGAYLGPCETGTLSWSAHQK